MALQPWLTETVLTFKPCGLYMGFPPRASLYPAVWLITWRRVSTCRGDNRKSSLSTFCVAETHADINTLMYGDNRQRQWCLNKNLMALQFTKWIYNGICSWMKLGIHMWFNATFRTTYAFSLSIAFWQRLLYFQARNIKTQKEGMESLWSGIYYKTQSYSHMTTVGGEYGM